jgi:undecaprenyl pyrophosphate phosphatase UppP
MENTYIGILVFVVSMVTSMVVFPFALKFARKHDYVKMIAYLWFIGAFLKSFVERIPLRIRYRTLSLNRVVHENK